MDGTEAIVAEVSRWEGVTVAPHERGGTVLRLGRRELGHVHPGGAADLPFTRLLRDSLIETGRAQAHPFAPDTGWVRLTVRSEGDAAAAVQLFQLAYERACVARARARDRSQRPKPGSDLNTAM